MPLTELTRLETTIAHPRLSVNAMCNFSWSFDQDLAFWKAVGVRHAGLLSNKLGDNPHARMCQLDEAGIRASTLIVSSFELREPESWDETRRRHREAIQLVAEHGGLSVYFTPGRTTGLSWNEDLNRFADAAAPSIAYGKKRGVRVAIEPSLRTSVSFINTLRDGIVVAERTGCGLITDFGNMWMERDFREVVARASPHTALVQICDLIIGSSGQPAPGGRVHIGEGELPLERLMHDVLGSGYSGVFDLEVVPADFSVPVSEAELRRGVGAASKLLQDLDC